MDAASLFWLFGQAFSIAVLIAGAVLTLLATRPFFGWFENWPSAPTPPPGAHQPLNHRLRLEAEW